MKKSRVIVQALSVLGLGVFLVTCCEPSWAEPVLTSGASANASSNAVNGSVNILVEELHKKGAATTKVAPSKFSLIAGFEANRSLHSESDYDLSGDLSVMLNPTYKINKNYVVGAIGALSKELTGENRDNLAIANTQIFFARTPVEMGPIKLGGGVFSTLATNKTAVEKDTLRGSAGANLKALFDFAEAAPLSGFFSCKGERYFHEFTTNADGQMNIQNKLTQSLNVAFAFGEQVSLSLQGDIIEAWTYRNTIKNSFSLSEELSLSISKHLSVYVGHSNSGNAYKYDGSESNIEFFNAQTSMARAGMTLSY